MDNFPEGVLNSEQLRSLQKRGVIQASVAIDAERQRFRPSPSHSRVDPQWVYQTNRRAQRDRAGGL